MINLPSIDSPQGINVTLRGLMPLGIDMREVAILEGRWFRSGQREVVVGKSVAKRYPGARLGKRLRFGRGEWEVVGVLDGDQSAINSEIWGDLNQISSDFNRQDNGSSVLVRAAAAGTVPALVRSLRRIAASMCRPQRAHLLRQPDGGLARHSSIWHSCFRDHGGREQLRRHEHHVCRGRQARHGNRNLAGARILAREHSAELPAGIAAAVVDGGILGCLLVLPLNNITTAVGSFVTFSEIAFNFQVWVVRHGGRSCLALIVGALGGFFPARAAARKEIVTALREA